ncbi:MAG: transcriptional activator RfaH [Betaproteobacteria bacterium]|nr:transcriptional activator RfaH [Betaproteobacteria bacterium]
MTLESGTETRDAPLPWYVAFTKPRQENVADEQLRRQGYGVYLPRLKVFRKGRSGGGAAVTACFAPMFPRYLFFRAGNPEQSIAPVRSTVGVTTIVRFGHEIAVMRPEVLRRIEAFERRQNAAGFDEISLFKPGTPVVVTDGPFAGLEGLVAMASEQRVLVLMELLGKPQRLHFKPHEIAAAA